METNKFIEIKSQNNRFQLISTIFRSLLATIFLSISISNCLYAGEPATITGDKVKILSRGEIMEFIGNVKLVQKNLKITADRMKSNEKTGIVSANGNVCIQYSSGTTTTYAWAETVKYNKNTGSGIAVKNVRVKRFLTRPCTYQMDLSDNTEEVMKLTCKKLEILDFGDRLHAIENVKIFKEHVETQSDEAFYDHKINKVLLLGNVRTKIVLK